jgi:hypothetical protein
MRISHLLRDAGLTLAVLAGVTLILTLITGGGLPVYGRTLRLLGIGAGILTLFGGAGGPLMMNGMGAQSSRAVMNAVKEDTQRRWYTNDDSRVMLAVLLGGLLAVVLGSLLA